MKQFLFSSRFGFLGLSFILFKKLGLQVMEISNTRDYGKLNVGQKKRC